MIPAPVEVLYWLRDRLRKALCPPRGPTGGVKAAGMRLSIYMASWATRSAHGVRVVLSEDTDCWPRWVARMELRPLACGGTVVRATPWERATVDNASWGEDVLHETHRIIGLATDWVREHLRSYPPRLEERDQAVIEAHTATVRAWYAEVAGRFPNFFPDAFCLDPRHKDKAMPIFVDPILRSAREALGVPNTNVILNPGQREALHGHLTLMEETVAAYQAKEAGKPDPATDWRRLESSAVINAALSTAGPDARVHTTYDDSVDGPLTVDIDGRENHVLTIARAAAPEACLEFDLFRVEFTPPGADGRGLWPVVAWSRVLELVSEWATPPATAQTTLDGSKDWRTYDRIMELDRATGDLRTDVRLENRTLPGKTGVRDGSPAFTLEYGMRLTATARSSMHFDVHRVSTGGARGNGAPCDYYSYRYTYDGTTFHNDPACTWSAVLAGAHAWGAEAVEQLKLMMPVTLQQGVAPDINTNLRAIEDALDDVSRATRGLPTDRRCFDPEDPSLPARTALDQLREVLATWPGMRRP